jgi:tetratricopeptide (TPR) repeat protein
MTGEHERAAACYPRSLELFTATGNEADVAHMRFRIAASMVMRGDTEAAWPLLEDILREARLLGNRLGECQALGYLAQREEGRGNADGALAMTLESAGIAEEIGWAWWAAYELRSAAEIERERGRLDAAAKHAFRALERSAGLGDARASSFAAAELASVAAASGNSAQAGLLWGAIETAIGVGSVGDWGAYFEEYEALVMRVDGPVFQQARDEGRLLSIPQAAGLEPF